MSRFRMLSVIFVATVIFVFTATLLSLMGYEIQRDSEFHIHCEKLNGVYFVSKSNQEYCAKSEFLISP